MPAAAATTRNGRTVTCRPRRCGRGRAEGRARAGAGAAATPVVDLSGGSGSSARDPSWGTGRALHSARASPPRVTSAGGRPAADGPHRRARRHRSRGVRRHRAPPTTITATAPPRAIVRMDPTRCSASAGARSSPERISEAATMSRTAPAATRRASRPVTSGAAARTPSANPAACASAGPSPSDPSPWLPNPMTAAAAGKQGLGRPADPAPARRRVAAQPDVDEPDGEQAGRDAGEDRDRARPRVRDQRRPKQGDEQAEERRPDIPGGDRQDRARRSSRRRPRRGPGSCRSAPDAAAHGAGVASSGWVGVWRIENVVIGQ